jgi:serine/threonine protein kinase/formylglycine-generating enzyme required for sulfatase activity
MGEVWLGHDTLLDRPVAVKFIGDFRPDVEARTQFLVEARAAARLSHPNVVTVYRVGELDGHPYIVSEFVRGKTLEQVEKPLPWRRALELGIGLSRGLCAAHRRGVLHRDIKPGNAIIDEDGTVKLLDFGLAKLMDRGSRPVLLDGTSPVPPRLTPRRAFMSPTPVPVHTERPTRRGETMSRRSRSLGDTLPATSRNPAVSTMTGAAGENSSVHSGSRSGELFGGTPHYMAPELWWGEPSSYRSDVYALGVLLFELCSGKPPFADASFYELASATATRDPPPLVNVAPGIEPAFGAVVDRCLRRDPSERFATGDELREALEALTEGARRDAIPEGNPYRGLLAFGAEHRTLFFGRTNEIGTVLERLRAEPLVVIAGDSGVGKSSLCQAGVLPRVLEGALGEGRTYSITRMTPGKRPLTALAAALSEALAEDDVEHLAKTIGEAPATLGRALRRRLGQERGFLLYVDQLEEMVTVGDAEEAALAAEALGHLSARIPGFRLLTSVRGDFLVRVASLPILGDALSRGLYLLRPLSPEKIREAIVGPARAKGVQFESEALIDELVASTSRAEGLPLLQFALAELWEARSEPRAPITAAALHAIGGVEGALARHADRVVQSLPAAQREAAWRILVDLVTLDGTRGYRTEAELCAKSPAARDALEALVRGRLLVAHEWEEGAIYEIAHEALLRGWGTLRRLIEMEDEARVVEQRLKAAAAEWERLGKSREALWGDRQLAEAKVLDPGRLGERERAFLLASRSALQWRHLRWRVVVVVVAALSLAFYGAIRFQMQRDLDRRVSVRIEEAQRLVEEARARSAEMDRLEKQAFALFDARNLAEGEHVWGQAQERAAEADSALGRTAQVLEAALILDTGRTAVRDLLADVLFERALAAERFQRPSQRDDLLARMALYDEDGVRRRRWDEPAQLSIATRPEGAQVRVERYVADGKRRRLERASEPFTTPRTDLSLPRGSYLLTLRAEGRAEVRYPVLLGRGERLALELELLPESDVPPGFIYVPRGRFLFGTSLDDSKRRGFLSTVPVHPQTTEAYFIARHEVTYADWLAYLRALSPEERARRMPKIGEAALIGALSLRETQGGVYQFTFKPSDDAYSALEGQPLVYRSRRARSTQDWLRFPVSGISMRDAEAYAAWVRETGRVKGARLCTEYEWERAARGADDREFPHGDALEPDDANIDETYGKEASSMGPDEVGSHPATRSPFGLDDMSGNVFEWTTSSLEPGRATIRGGGYYYDQMTARSTNRTTLEANLRDPRLGLRLCATVTRASEAP